MKSYSDALELSGNTLEQEEDRAANPWLLALSGMAIMLCLGTVYSWSVFRVSIEQVYNISAFSSGMPYMVSLAFYAVFVLLAGRYLGSANPKTVTALGGLLVGLGWIISGYANNILVLTISYGVITGAGVGIVYGVPMMAVTKWFPQRKGLMLGLVLIGFGLSPLLTAPLARYLLSVFGVSLTFKTLGLAFCVLIPLLGSTLSYPKAAKTSTPDNLEMENEVDTSAMLKSRSFRGLYVCFFIGTLIGLTLIGITSNIGVELIGLSAHKVAFYMSVFAIFNGLGRILFGWLADKISYKKTMLLSYLLIGFATLLMFIARETGTMLYAAAFSIYWLNLGGWLAIAPLTTIELFGRKHYSQNYGVVFTAYGFGAIVGVSATGILKDVFGSYSIVFYLVMLLCAAGIWVSQTMIGSSNPN